MGTPVTTVDRALRDGDEVRLGSSVLVARLTAVHTRDCTTWTLSVDEGGETHDASHADPRSI